MRITRWVGSDGAGHHVSRRSCSGGLLALNDAVITSWARMQATPALCSGEAEHHAVGFGFVEMLFIKHFLGELGHATYELKFAQTAKSLDVWSSLKEIRKTKHIELRFLFVQEVGFASLAFFVVAGFCPCDFSITPEVSNRDNVPLANKLSSQTPWPRQPSPPRTFPSSLFRRARFRFPWPRHPKEVQNPQESQTCNHALSRHATKHKYMNSRSLSSDPSFLQPFLVQVTLQ